MTKQMQFRRGTKSENNSFTGAVGEVVVDTDTHTLRVHDGATTGGYEIAKKSELEALNSVVVHSTGNEVIDGTKTFKYIHFGKTNNDLEGGEVTFDAADNEPNAQKSMKIDRYNGQMRFLGAASTATSTTSLLTLNFENNTVTISGNVHVSTQTTSDKSGKVATTEYVQNNLHDLLFTLYPVGSIYIGTQSVCPLVSLMSGTEWRLISDNRVLQCSSTQHAAATTIPAGLPNITGSIWNDGSNDEGPLPGKAGANGVFTVTRAGNNNGASGGSPTGAYNFDFDASRSNSIYGNSNTVQPAAYVVNVWRRTL